MKLKKFIYAILLVALFLPGCNEETVELNVSLTFPRDGQGSLIQPEKLHFAVFDGDAVLQQESVKFSAGKVSLTAPMGKNLSLGVLGSKKEAVGDDVWEEQAILIGSVSLNDLSEQGEGENKSITVELKTFYERMESFSINAPGANALTCSWDDMGFPKTSYHVIVENKDEKSAQVYDGADSSCAFKLKDHGIGEYWDVDNISFYATFDAFNLKTRTFFNTLREYPLTLKGRLSAFGLSEELKSVKKFHYLVFRDDTPVDIGVKVQSVDFSQGDPPGEIYFTVNDLALQGETSLSLAVLGTDEDGKVILLGFSSYDFATTSPEEGAVSIQEALSLEKCSFTKEINSGGECICSWNVSVPGTTFDLDLTHYDDQGKLKTSRVYSGQSMDCDFNIMENYGPATKLHASLNFPAFGSLKAESEESLKVGLNIQLYTATFNGNVHIVPDKLHVALYHGNHMVSEIREISGYESGAGTSNIFIGGDIDEPLYAFCPLGDDLHLVVLGTDSADKVVTFGSSDYPFDSFYVFEEEPYNFLVPGGVYLKDAQWGRAYNLPITHNFVQYKITWNHSCIPNTKYYIRKSGAPNFETQLRDGFGQVPEVEQDVSGWGSFEYIDFYAEFPDFGNLATVLQEHLKP